MTLTVRLPDKEENLLESTARRLGRNKSDLARQAVYVGLNDFASRVNALTLE